MGTEGGLTTGEREDKGARLPTPAALATAAPDKDWTRSSINRRGRKTEVYLLTRPVLIASGGLHRPSRPRPTRPRTQTKHRTLLNMPG